MEKLQLSISKNGHLYTQLMRTETKAIYQQQTKDGLIAGHEVFIVKKLKERETLGTTMNAREKFPSNADFGVTAWSTGVQLQNAIDKYNSLK